QPLYDTGGSYPAELLLPQPLQGLTRVNGTTRTNAAGPQPMQDFQGQLLGLSVSSNVGANTSQSTIALTLDGLSNMVQTDVVQTPDAFERVDSDKPFTVGPVNGAVAKLSFYASAVPDLAKLTPFMAVYYDCTAYRIYLNGISMPIRKCRQSVPELALDQRGLQQIVYAGWRKKGITTGSMCFVG